MPGKSRLLTSALAALLCSCGSSDEPNRADTTPPTVTVAVLPGTVHGQVTLNASANDDHVVAEVQFLVDGLDVGVPDQTAPYSAIWSSIDGPNGSHTLSATATDRAGNSATSAGVAVSVDNFVVDSIHPDGGGAVDPWPDVTLFFSHPIDPASLSDATLYLTEAITPVHSGFIVAPNARSVTLLSPLLPGDNYGVFATAGVKRSNGDPLDRPVESAFLTRLGTPFPLSGSTNLGNRILLEAGGTVHVIGVWGTTLTHALCSANCTSAGSWQSNAISGVSANFFPSATIDGQDALHVLFYSGGLNYATCSTSCDQGSNWSSGVIDTVDQAGMSSSLVVDGSGTLHAVYSNWSDGHLYYGTCSAACTQSASWSFGPLPVSLISMQDLALVVAPSGALHLVYRGQVASNYPIHYATCSASCTSSGNWQDIVLEIPASPGSGSSLAIDQNGVLHHAYYLGTAPLRYGSCATNCLVLANWSVTQVDAITSGIKVSIAVSGERRAILYAGNNGALRGASCSDQCNVSASWRSRNLDPSNNTGLFPDVVFGSDRQPRYTDGALGFIHYTE